MLSFFFYLSKKMVTKGTYMFIIKIIFSQVNFSYYPVSVSSFNENYTLAKTDVRKICKIKNFRLLIFKYFY